MTFIPLEKLHRLTDGYQQSFDVRGRKLLLIHHAGQTRLIENQCPHAGYPLDAASIENHEIRCPLHGIAFDLRDGKALPEFRSACPSSIKFVNTTYDKNLIGILVET